MYSEWETRHLRVAHYDPREPPVIGEYTANREAAELFGELVTTNLRGGADVRTVESWARSAGKYGRLAIEARDANVRLLLGVE